jgi:hypothetical protein
MSLKVCQFDFHLWRCVLDITLCDKVRQLHWSVQLNGYVVESDVKLSDPCLCSLCTYNHPPVTNITRWFRVGNLLLIQLYKPIVERKRFIKNGTF